MFGFFWRILGLLKQPEKTLGAEESPIDLRNIQLAQFQKPVELPDFYETEMPFVEDQGVKPKCVGASISKIKELYLMQQGEVVDLSDDDLYESCKLEDGIPFTDGTYPVVGAKIACKQGIASLEAYRTRNKAIIEESRAKHKMQGYAFVAPEYDAICQAIYQNKAIVAAFMVDNNWFVGTITRVLKAIGRHLVILHGFSYPQKILIGQNSWGTNWIGKLAGKLNPSIKSGHFEMSWNDYNDNIGDIIAFTDIPKKILDEVKVKPYIFTSTLRVGMRNFEVKKLQERLGVDADGVFGYQTKKAVIDFQRENGLTPDGVVGPTTRTVLNGKASKIDLWCRAIEKMEGAKPELNNPGNIKYVGQKSAIGKDKRGFCIFPSYEVGYNELKNLLLRACTGQSANYKPEMTLEEFYAGVPMPNRFGKVIYGYAPNSDGNDSNNYARFVSKFVGVETTTLIKELL